MKRACTFILLMLFAVSVISISSAYDIPACSHCNSTLPSFSKFIKQPQIRDIPQDIPKPSPITGDVLLSDSANDAQKLYLKSLPGVVKILVYAKSHFYLPNITSVDYTDYDRKYALGLDPAFEDIDIEYDANENFMEDVNSGKFDPMWFGSGFVINPEGYILTNAHVGRVDKAEIADLLRNTTLLYFYLNMEDAYAYNESYDDEAYFYDAVFLSFMDKYLRVDIEETEMKVLLGVNKSKEGMVMQEYTPRLVDSELASKVYSEEGLDWALLKIEGNNFATVEIGDSDKMSTGADVFVIGYPDVSETVYTAQEMEKNYSFRMDVEPTLTKGYISSIKAIGGGYQVFQTDAGISGGNSGGPALNSEGKVIGIATYGYDSYMGGNYNYLLRINDIVKKISKYTSPARGEVDRLWTEGLDSYWEKDYSASKEKFENILALSPNHPYVQNMLYAAGTKSSSPEAAQASSSKSAGSGSNALIWVMIIIGIGIVILLSIIVVNSFRNRASVKGKR